jgi:hypothetical protein
MSRRLDKAPLVWYNVSIEDHMPMPVGLALLTQTDARDSLLSDQQRGQQ